MLLYSCMNDTLMMQVFSCVGGLKRQLHPIYRFISILHYIEMYACYMLCMGLSTVEPPKKGHFGNGTFVLSSEVVLISEVHEIF